MSSSSMSKFTTNLMLSTYSSKSNFSEYENFTLNRKKIFVRVKDENNGDQTSTTINVISSFGGQTYGPYVVVEGETLIIELEIDQLEYSIEIISMEKNNHLEYWCEDL